MEKINQKYKCNGNKREGRKKTNFEFKKKNKNKRKSPMKNE